MAIGPVTDMTDDDLRAAADIEMEIDSRIKADYDGEDTLSVSLKVFPRQRIRRFLSNKYGQVGWGLLEWKDDQRDGPYVVLSRKMEYTTGRD